MLLLRLSPFLPRINLLRPRPRLSCQPYSAVASYKPFQFPLASIRFPPYLSHYSPLHTPGDSPFGQLRTQKLQHVQHFELHVRRSVI